jgi:hypothetical protein
VLIGLIESAIETGNSTCVGSRMSHCFEIVPLQNSFQTLPLHAGLCEMKPCLQAPRFHLRAKSARKDLQVCAVERPSGSLLPTETMMEEHNR